jgi:hypothetical protein
MVSDTRPGPLPSKGIVQPDSLEPEPPSTVSYSGPHLRVDVRFAPEAARDPGLLLVQNRIDRPPDAVTSSRGGRADPCCLADASGAAFYLQLDAFYRSVPKKT